MAGKRKERDLVAPDITEDAAERKRILNILAQRRYRQRRKHRIQALEAQLKGVSPHNAEISFPGVEKDRGGIGLPTEVLSPSSTPATLDRSNTITLDYEGQEMTASVGPETCPAGTASGFSDITLVPEVFTGPFLPAVPHLLPSELPTLGSPFITALSPRTLGQTSLGSLISTTGAPLGVSPLSLFPGPENSAQGHSDGDDVQCNSFFSDPESAYNISDDLQDYQSSNFTFPDDHLLQVPSLTLLSAAVRVAQRLGIGDCLWDIAAVSPFHRPRVYTQPSTSSPPCSLPPSSTSSTIQTSDPSQTSDGGDTNNIDPETLPEHLRPTRTQVLISHHPILDLLPWPTVRDKLIQVFNLPVNLRPKSAQDPMGLVRLVYDMEDVGGEGIRVHSSDPFEVAGWEIGQLMFERWWWAFETDTVERSNRGRRERGEKCLELS